MDGTPIDGSGRTLLRESGGRMLGWVKSLGEKKRKSKGEGKEAMHWAGGPHEWKP